MLETPRQEKKMRMEGATSLSGPMATLPKVEFYVKNTAIDAASFDIAAWYFMGITLGQGAGTPSLT